MESQMLSLPIAQAHFPNPFYNGLEFNAPVRGPWNIVHMALAVPESHLLYICARGCLRGVLMTAAEMGALERMSWIGVREEDLAAGLLEQTTLASAKAILAKLTPKPPLVFVYLSCIHKFAQIDYDFILEELKKAFPEIRCIGCHMMPTMRKSGPTDEERTKAKMFEALKTPQSLRDDYLTHLGSEWPLQKDSSLAKLISSANLNLLELPSCQTYADYQNLATSSTLLVTQPNAIFAAQELTKRLPKKILILPLSHNFFEIRQSLKQFASHFKLNEPKYEACEAKTTAFYDDLASFLQDRPIALDYTFTPRPLSLARFLLEAKLNLTTIYLDAIHPLEEADFKYLKAKYPKVNLARTLAPSLRLTKFRKESMPSGGDVLALGQKAAYLAETNYFVNLVSFGGLYGTEGLDHLANLMKLAANSPKERREIIQEKGLGLPHCFKLAAKECCHA
ncbi:MAG: hypothetical protein IJS50_04185, partial [Desulfovibrio sp.]|nr:hypothetical protein [Desulfovibrio sp.]